MHASTAMLVTRPENIKVTNKFRLEQHAPEKVRASGNEKFREKKYVEALSEYELSLGLTHNTEHTRERAILYANSSQCLFEMRLYQSALLYAAISVAIDKKYAKGLYRKFICYL
jgi:tetratricopeptide (TPR) repeat protein